MDLSATLAIASAVIGNRAAAAEDLSEAEVEAVLDLTRAVAHATERKAAPLAAYALGRAMMGLSEHERLGILKEISRRIDDSAGT